MAKQPSVTMQMRIELPKTLLDDRLAQGVGMDALTQMRIRVQKGFNLSDQQMPPYAPMTKAFRSRKGRQTGRRDLTFTGRMLGSLHADVAKMGPSHYRVTIRLADGRARLLAAKHQAVDPWMGFSRKDQRAIAEGIEVIVPKAWQRKIDKPSDK